MSRSDDTPLHPLASEQMGSGGADVVAFVGEVEQLRQLASGPAPQPSPQLQTVLAGGLSPAGASLTADQGDLPVTAASNVHGSAATQTAGLPTRRRSTMKTNLITLLTKLAGIGAAAKVALAAGVVAASAGGFAAAAAVGHSTPHHGVGPATHSATAHSPASDNQPPAAQPGQGTLAGTGDINPAPTGSETPDPSESGQPDASSGDGQAQDGSGDATPEPSDSPSPEASQSSTDGSGDVQPSASPTDGSGDVQPSASPTDGSGGGTSDGGSGSGSGSGG